MDEPIIPLAHSFTVQTPVSSYNRILMGKLRRLQPVAVALLLAFFLSSCLGKHLPTFRGRGHKLVTSTSPPLKVATRDELNAIIARTYNAIDSFSASSVELTASVGSVHKADVVEYPSAPGYIIFRKPGDIRIHATYPYVGTLAFDMVSNVNDFKFSLPKNNSFVVGLNSAPATSQNKMENLRPVAFLSSMLIRPWDPATESIMLKDDTDEEDALYRLEFNLKGKDGIPIPGREVWFDRQDLSIVQQKIYDADGNILSDTRYSEWQLYDGVSFPAHIDINRRMDGYGVVIKVLKMEMNKEVTNAQFVLEQPEGSTLKRIGTE